MRLLTILFLAFLLASSCTIQKRTFRNGFYISWNKPLKAKKDQTVSPEPESETGPKEELSVISKDTVCETRTEFIQEHLAVNEEQDSVQRIAQTTICTETAMHESPNEVITPVLEREDLRRSLETNEKRPNLFAINSLVFAIGYVILGFITIFTNLFALAIICFLLAITFAIIAIKKWKDHKDNFWGTFFAVIALGLLVLGTLILLLFILAGSI
nr:hypothetical protein [uncultured Fluviicola sp.]